MKTLLKYILMLCASLLSLFEISAQSVFIQRQSTSSCGGSLTAVLGGKEIFVQQSIGQASVTGTFRKGKTVLRQGFIQPALRQVYREQNKGELNVSLFPNPCRDELFINSSDYTADEVFISVYDITGKLLIREMRKRDLILKLDFSNLQAGTYILKIVNGQLSTTKKIIKL